MSRLYLGCCFSAARRRGWRLIARAYSNRNLPELTRGVDAAYWSSRNTIQWKVSMLWVTCGGGTLPRRLARAVILPEACFSRHLLDCRVAWASRRKERADSLPGRGFVGASPCSGTMVPPGMQDGETPSGEDVGELLGTDAAVLQPSETARRNGSKHPRKVRVKGQF